jgi:hypothetical protein
LNCGHLTPKPARILPVQKLTVIQAYKQKMGVTLEYKTKVDFHEDNLENHILKV